MKNKALLVGINDYPLPGNDLRGCINDIEDMRHFIAKGAKTKKASAFKKAKDLGVKKVIVKKPKKQDERRQ